MTKVNIELTMEEYRLLEVLVRSSYSLNREIDRDSDGVDFTEDVRIVSKQERKESELLEKLGIDYREIIEDIRDFELRKKNR